MAEEFKWPYSIMISSPVHGKVIGFFFTSCKGRIIPDYSRTDFVTYYFEYKQDFDRFVAWHKNEFE